MMVTFCAKVHLILFVGLPIFLLAGFLDPTFGPRAPMVVALLLCRLAIYSFDNSIMLDVALLTVIEWLGTDQK